MILKKTKTAFFAALSMLSLSVITLNSCSDGEKTEVKTENVVVTDSLKMTTDTTKFTDSAATRPVKTPD